MIVIGNGNVALDVARMLALTHDELAPTDATDASIAAIESSPIREIVLVGRRGPAQAAFTTPELQEMGELAGADVVVDPADLVGAKARGHERGAKPRPVLRRALLARVREGKARRVAFRFFHSPVAILGEERVGESSSSATSSTPTTARCRPTSA